MIRSAIRKVIYYGERIFVIVLIPSLIILLVIWFFSASNLPRTTILYHQTFKGTDIIITSPVYFTTHQKANLNRNDSVFIYIILPKFKIHKSLPFKGIIEDKTISDNLIQYKVKITRAIHLNYKINDEQQSDSTNTLFKIVSVVKAD